MLLELVEATRKWKDTSVKQSDQVRKKLGEDSTHILDFSYIFPIPSSHSHILVGCIYRKRSIYKTLLFVCIHCLCRSDSQGF
jgi:hypothetical protein